MIKEQISISQGLVHRLLTHYQPEIEQKCVNFNIDIDKSIHLAQVEPKNLAEILGQVVDNMLNFLATGSQIVFVVTGATRNEIEIEISDTEKQLSLNSIQANLNTLLGFYSYESGDFRQLDIQISQGKLKLIVKLIEENNSQVMLATV